MNDIAINAAFDSGNIEVLEVSGTSARLAIRKDHQSDFFQWFHFRVSAPAGQEVVLDLDSDFVRAFYNPVAAMPSLHVGMAPVVAWALIRLTPWGWSHALGVPGFGARWARLGSTSRPST